MKMIEKVARAIAEANSKEPNVLAIIAIEAMRVPTDAMMNIYYELNHKAGPSATFDVSTWERSIDAILKE